MSPRSSAAARVTRKALGIDRTKTRLTRAQISGLRAHFGNPDTLSMPLLEATRNIVGRWPHPSEAAALIGSPVDKPVYRATVHVGDVKPKDMGRVIGHAGKHFIFITTMYDLVYVWYDRAHQHVEVFAVDEQKAAAGAHAVAMHLQAAMPAVVVTEGEVRAVPMHVLMKELPAALRANATLFKPAATRKTLRVNAPAFKPRTPRQSIISNGSAVRNGSENAPERVFAIKAASAAPQQVARPYAPGAFTTSI